MTHLEKFLCWETSIPDSLFLNQPIHGEWKTWTYREAGSEIRRVAAGLQRIGLPFGSHIAILSKNCAHWILADLAIAAAGFVGVPIYPTLSAEGVKYILDHSDTKLIFLGKLDTFDQQRSGISDSIKRISFPFYGPDEGEPWQTLLKSEPLAEIQFPSPEGTASIMYSSGTTGAPKGVMLSFKAFDFAGNAIVKNFGIRKKQRFVSYLPLSHIAEKAYVEMGVIYSGSSISFVESLDKFSDNLREIKPNLFGGVPRIFTKLQQGILSKLPSQKLDKLLSLPLVSFFIKKLLRKKLGFEKTTLFVGGAAPLPVPLLQWFMRIGIPITEVYGMTENCGYSHGDHGNNLRFGSVGRPWPEVKTKFLETGEILVKHDGLMKGYYKDALATAEVFSADGYLKTGDLGVTDKDGFLTITGRVKDQFKTDKAKYISPAPIELKLLSNKDIEQVCVVGVGIPQPIALVVLSAVGKLKSREVLTQSLSETINEINNRLEHFEKLEKAIVLKKEWTVENGLLTPSLKLKRNELEKIYVPHYAQWYGKEDIVIWEE
jgi:long-chain acyl-CoA synthetase